MHARRALAVVPAVLLAIAAPSLAAPKPKPVPPQIVDPKGDSAGGQAGFDILSVEYKTTGTGAGKSYLPKKLSVILTLAAAPHTEGVFAYNVDADTDNCGKLSIKYSPGYVIGGVIGDTYATFGSCAEGIFFPAKVKGSVVTFDFELKSIGIDRGTEFSAFTASVDISDPVASTVGTDLLAQTTGVLDKASGDGTWIVP
jgi:hypothetical protein